MEKPKCKLIGMDGNIFVLLGKAIQALRSARQYDQEKQIAIEVSKAESYDQALQILMKYVNIE